MELHYSAEFERLIRYSERKSMQLLERLGSGVDGLVYSTNKGSAVKAHRGMRLFEQELRVYQRLARYPEKPVPGFNVPKMLDFHTELWVIEMQLVVVPFVLDFAGATLDKPSPTIAEQSEEDFAEWEADKIEAFGEDDWQSVTRLLSHFRRMGIFLSDVHKGNIRFRDE